MCEYSEEARDNAYWLFKYLRENQPQVDAVYAINKYSSDYKKVYALGEIVQFGSLKHWIYYISAEVNISSQKGGKPNAAVCYALEVNGIWRNRRVFLQHGIILSSLPYLYYSNARFSLVMCGAAPEYISIKKEYGYPDNAVSFTGMCRFDRLHHVQNDPKIVMIVPTWRDYITNTGMNTMDFSETEYCKKWNELLCSEELITLLKEYDMYALFCPHRNMRRYGHSFKSSSHLIKIIDWNNMDISKGIEKASVLITDYSSISMDFAYMKRPLIYYQFDYERFRSEHLQKSYFDFYTNGFGPVCLDVNSLLDELAKVIESGYKMSTDYLERHNQFFPLYDDKNCQRTYLSIRNHLLE